MCRYDAARPHWMRLRSRRFARHAPGWSQERGCGRGGGSAIVLAAPCRTCGRCTEQEGIYKRKAGRGSVRAMDDPFVVIGAFAKLDGVPLASTLAALFGSGSVLGIARALSSRK